MIGGVVPSMAKEDCEHLYPYTTIVWEAADVGLRSFPSNYVEMVEE